MLERTDKHFKSELKIIFSHGFIPKRVMARQKLFDISHLLKRQTNMHDEPTGGYHRTSVFIISF